MLSYLHGFHAGNFADMHKHAALWLILEHLRKKKKPFCVIDTHAGSGWYDLGSEQAAKTGEWKDGYACAKNGANAPEMLQQFLNYVAAFDPVAKGRDYGVREGDDYQGPFYPGSPFIIRDMLRDEDELVLMELHPREHEMLHHRVKRDARIHLHKRDGYEGVVAMMPPAIRRGLVLMDPSYDVKQDYQKAAKAIREAWEKWPTATFMLWYPILLDGFDADLRKSFAAIKASGGVLSAELATDQGGAKGRMRGTGLLVINPPWQFDQQLGDIGDWLAKTCKLPGPANHQMRWLVPAA
ncbi:MULTISPECIES: 23S rRNA (adenine(2030)-N(6))-methyltransferase RlmJ [unclassified Thalassospira]|uniref:23S rRNA (adenine(2030)-N(6))-methyltransferase RlmJ n=1 Tax=unclassified Thalassospira TaxID=2648997 RepID=UPI0007A5DA10|nr:MULTISPECIES: 23S rRNA (adenine(2030)-N(6))-methyltransferase RlmJ [unclassified Thalassospira]KZC98624.1 DNA utilization protein YhiR [Thalassospira sp. MCCC 1A02898]ONH86510.1 protein involved in external DNA uptake [Thalassospira sp. MCCC 1A02803]